MKNKETKEVAVQQKQEVAVSAPPAGNATGSQVLSSDVLIPSLLLQQALSEFVVEKKASAGDFVRSTNAEKIGDDSTPVQIIPLAFHNLWLLTEDVNGKGKFEFRGYEPRTPVNENEPWDFTKQGVNWRRTKIMRLFALLPQDIDKYEAAIKKFEESGEVPDLESALLPVVLTFKNTSFKAAREIATLFIKADSLSRKIGKPVPAYGSMFEISCYLDKNDKGSYYVMEAKQSGKTKDSHKEHAQIWFSEITKGGANLNIDDAEAREVAKENNQQAYNM